MSPNSDEQGIVIAINNLNTISANTTLAPRSFISYYTTY